MGLRPTSAFRALAELCFPPPPDRVYLRNTSPGVIDRVMRVFGFSQMLEIFEVSRTRPLYRGHTAGADISGFLW